MLDCRAVKLCEIVIGPNDVITYRYDFGDGWNHRLEVEAFLPKDKSLTYPVCTDGQMAGPPEDSGGIHAFCHSLEILKDKKHPDHKETAQWLPKKYKPEGFDREKVNRQLARLDSYIRKWLSGSE